MHSLRSETAAEPHPTHSIEPIPLAAALYPYRAQSNKDRGASADGTKLGPAWLQRKRLKFKQSHKCPAQTFINVLAQGLMPIARPPNVPEGCGSRWQCADYKCHTIFMTIFRLGTICQGTQNSARDALEQKGETGCHLGRCSPDLEIKTPRVRRPVYGVDDSVRRRVRGC